MISSQSNIRRIRRGAWALAFLLPFATAANAQAGPLATRIQQIVHDPAYRHATFGIEVYSLDQHRILYQQNAQMLFVPASTTKLVTEGSALELLGPDYRFHTRVYRTGPIAADGTLQGDLVLVASGDPNLSGRIQPNDTLAFENVDHSYSGSVQTRAVPGDPLLVIRQLAEQVAAHGIKRIAGQVRVDASLFPEGQRELGTRVVLSPIVVNDNLVDVTATPGGSEGAPARLEISPATAYVRFINQTTTGPAGEERTIHFGQDRRNADGSHTVRVIGSMPAGSPAVLYAYRVPEPSRFAEMALVQALRARGVQAGFASYGDGRSPDFQTLSASYTAPDLVAEHISPPFSQDVKVTLKVSQNLHASLTPYILGAVLSHAQTDADQAGFDLEHKFLTAAGLNLAGAVQSDGAGGAALFTPDFMVHYLAFMSTQKNFSLFYNSLPVLGRNGTLYNIQTASPAAGHVHAKTGTNQFFDELNRDLLIRAKGLAGYMTTADGRHLVFAAYVNRVAVPRNPLVASLDQAEATAGQTLGSIATAIFESTAPGAAAPVPSGAAGLPVHHQ